MPRNRNPAVIATAIVIVFLLLPACHSASSGDASPGSSSASSSAKASQMGSAVGSSAQADRPSSSRTYEDARWPTAEGELLAIPENMRWYNAYKLVGSYGDVVGPVASVVHKPNVQGSPTFVNIGEDYPSSDRVQVVVWGDMSAECSDWLSNITPGRTWIDISGYISLYGDVVQIDVGDGYSVNLQQY